MERRATSPVDQVQAMLKLTQSQDTSWMRGVSLACEIGGPHFDLHSSILQLRRLLAKHCLGPYSEEVLGFALVLRIDGSLKQYGAEGVDRIRRNKKDKYIGADICIPEKRWREVPEAEFNRYLAAAVKSALETCAAYLKKQKVLVDKESLLLDYAEAEADFLKRRQ